MTLPGADSVYTLFIGLKDYEFIQEVSFLVIAFPEGLFFRMFLVVCVCIFSIPILKLDYYILYIALYIYFYF